MNMDIERSILSNSGHDKSQTFEKQNASCPSEHRYGARPNSQTTRVVITKLPTLSRTVCILPDRRPMIIKTLFPRQ